MSIKLDELVGVLVHEIHHVLLGHILTDPRAYPDRWALVMAQEVTVNEFVAEPLPATPILLRHFPNLPPMESTPARYQRLAKTKARKLLIGANGVPIALDVDGTAGDAPSPPSLDGRLGAGPAPRKKTRGGSNSAALVDDHSVWAQALADQPRAETAIRTAVHDAVIDLGAGAVPKELQTALIAMGIGKFGADGRYELQRNATGTLPWVRLLRRYAGQFLRVRPDFRRPPRKCPKLIGVLPGRSRQSNRPKVMAVIDTSGSITGELLEQISAELALMAMEYTVTVVECDAVVHAVYPYQPLKVVNGRGGTDLRPPLEAAFLTKHRPDLAVYFTDGLGPAHVRAPRVPVVWCLTPDGSPPAEWGRIIRMATRSIPEERS
jgi:hypothetical protein